jgi:aromatic-amino-acid transaminase
MFDHLEPYAGDPILGLFEAYMRDERPHKVNLSIGIYFDDQGRIPVLASVHEAEARMLKANAPKSYLSIEGSAAARQAVQALLFATRDDASSAHPDGVHEAVTNHRIATIQSVGASGSLKVACDFLKRWLPDAQVWVSDPTWDNHRAMFEGSGIAVNTYPYYDAATGGVRLAEMLATLSQLPAQSIVLLHACCHNPTGVDLSAAQWADVVRVVRERRLLPFVDLAYQGFGDGLYEDAHALRMLADAKLPFIVTASFSKSMSVYGERAGALNVVCENAAQAKLVLGQLQVAVRRNYSSPPLHAAGIMAGVLGDKVLRTQWTAEVGAMRERILAMRRALHAALVERMPGRDFGYFLTQRGMFSYTGLTAAQVDRLREVHGVYLVRSGRMCVAGLTRQNVSRVAQAFAEVMA